MEILRREDGLYHPAHWSEKEISYLEMAYEQGLSKDWEDGYKEGLEAGKWEGRYEVKDCFNNAFTATWGPDEDE